MQFQWNLSGLRERRYAIPYPFRADAETLDLKSGAHLAGVTSDLSPGGCFVCTSRLLETGTRVHLTLETQRAESNDARGSARGGENTNRACVCRPRFELQ